MFYIQLNHKYKNLFVLIIWIIELFTSDISTFLKLSPKNHILLFYELSSSFQNLLFGIYLF